MRRLLLGLALLAGILLPGLGAPDAQAEPSAQPADSGVGVRLVDVPTATSSDPRASSYIIDHLRPGTTINRRIEVVNHGPTSAEVSVYPAAASIGDGGFVGAAGHTANEVSSWTSTSPRALRLTPGQRAFVKVTVRVPAEAVRGEKYGVLWAQVTKPADDSGVRQVNRAGIRLYLSVGPGGTPPSDFKIVSITAARDEHNAPVIRATVRNTGERALDLSGAVVLSRGPGGLSAGPFPITLGTTLGIAETEPVEVKLDQQVPDGPWLTKITVKSGVTTRTAQATLTFPSGPGSGPAAPPASPYRLLPWLAAAIAVTVFMLILARRLHTRRIQTAASSAANGHQ